MTRVRQRETATPILLLGLGLIFLPSPAFAYVDPGILAALYQVVYVFIFGVLASWIFKPWRYLKSLLFRDGRVDRSVQNEIGTPNESQKNASDAKKVL